MHKNQFERKDEDEEKNDPGWVLGNITAISLFRSKIDDMFLFFFRHSFSE